MEKTFDVLIVGGGAAGLSIAARLRRERPRLSVGLLDPSDRHFYQPLWTLVGAGEFAPEVSVRGQATLIPDGVEWIRSAATEIDPERRRVKCADGEWGYGVLVLVPGIQIDWAKVKGLPETLGRDGVCSNYAYESVGKTWDFVRTFKGGTAIFTQPNTLVKCGGAPQKAAYMSDDHFRRAGVREKSRVIFASGAAGIFAVEKYACALRQVVERKGIETLYKHNLIEVRPGSREAIFERLDGGEPLTLKYDLLHVSPPMSAPDFIKRGSLANAEGWVDVDARTLQHLRYPNVFSAGDASSLPTSKTAAAVRKQAPVLVQNLLAYLAGTDLTASYDGYTSCPLTTGYGKLILAEFDYEQRPQESFPFDQSKERRSMYLLKKHLLPALYWEGMLKGRA